MEKQYIRTPVSSPIDVRQLVTVFRLEYDSDTASPHGESHDFYELVSVESGLFRADVDGVTHELKPGEMLIYAPNALHVRSAEPCKALIYIVSFETAAPIEGDICNRVLRPGGKQYALLSELFTDALGIQKEHSRQKELHGMTLINSDNRLALQKIKNKLELLLIDLCESAAPAGGITASNTDNAQSADMMRINAFLTARLGEDLTLYEIADGCQMSVSKLKKLFARRQRGGVIGHFNDLKIKEAKHLIRNTDLTFTEISGRLGFAYPHYFSRLFRQKTGMTPTEYAKHIDKR